MADGEAQADAFLAALPEGLRPPEPTGVEAPVEIH
jgi:hypothetical protein